MKIERLLNTFSSDSSMEKRNIIRFILLFFLVIVMLFSFQSVLSEELNLTDEEKAVRCINYSEEIINELRNNNFSFLRINDSLKEAKNLFEVQKTFGEKGKSTDYSSILETCEEIALLKVLAFDLQDQIGVLDDFYKSSLEGIETSEIEGLLSQISQEMINERYELVPELIEKTYSEIILAQSRATTLNVFYDATTRGVKRFFQERWLELVIGFFVLIFLIFLLKKPIEKMIIRRRLTLVEIRKKSLKDMITKNQDQYFNKGKMSEESFTVKSKKLAEIIRDVDREISILKQQLYALDRKKSLNKKGVQKRHK
jgi:hypothetical protein